MQLQDYCIYYRWGRFRLTKAFSQEHADQKVKRIQAGYERIHGPGKGEFRAEPVSDEWLTRFGKRTK